jgi:hypothetical protein
MQKFTPGPWTLCRTIDGEKTVAFHVAADPHGSLHPVVEYREGKVRAPEEIEANARLISAAPEMYDALAPFAEFARVYLAQGPGGNRPTEGAIYSISFAGGDAEITVEALQRALAALAKATGA